MHLASHFVLVPAVALCLAAGTHAATIQVSSASDISSAMLTASPGDVLEMVNGTWTDEEITFVGFGTSTQPITLRAQTPGMVVLNGSSKIEMGGTHLVIEGLRFEGGSLTDGHVIRFKDGSTLAHHCTLRDTAIIDYNPPSTDTRYFWVSLHGTNNVVEDCLFINQNHSGVVVCIWDDFPNNHIVRRNYFKDHPEDPNQANGWETIRIGTSDFVDLSSQTLIEENYFERCDGEIEIISSKTGDNIMRRNTFSECKGTLTLRHGFSALVYGNAFLGNDRSGSGGVRVVGPGHRVWNNYFEKLDARAGATITLYAGEINGPNSGYLAMTDVIVAHNTIVDSQGPAFDLATGLGSSNRTVLPDDVTIVGNLVATPGETVASSTNPMVTWTDNIAFASGLGTASGGGVTLVGSDPVAPGADGLERPFAGSAAENAVNPLVSFVPDDIDGQARTAAAEAGADEISGAAQLYTPITVDDVGPSWWPLAPPGVDPSLGFIFEAENADQILDPDMDGSIFTVASVASASNGEVLLSPSGSRTNLPGHETIAVYELDAPDAGTYTAYYRVRGFSGSTDSFFTPTGFDLDPTEQQTTSTNGTFQWELGDDFVVPGGAGTLEFRIGRREQDTEIDAIILYPANDLTDQELDFLLEEALVPPCPIDLDGSGDYNFFDLAIFLQLHHDEDPSADIVDDDVYDRFDVTAFLQLTSQGCP
ncbi:MAG: polysaccharide lyase 6 family protein [Planctomycetota bacterium]